MAQGTSTIIIVLTIIGTGVALALVIMPSIRELRSELVNLGRDLGERVARIEGILQSHGFNGSRRRPYETSDLQTREEK